MTVIVRNTRNGRVMTVNRDDAPALPPREQTSQASGVCFTEAGQIVLV